MDAVKCRALKQELAGQPEPQTVSLERFLDGNDDLGSIGCNLKPHPGMGAFRDILTGLSRRPDVQAVYVLISELDPGNGWWPFTDIVLVFGRIPADELSRIVKDLRPSEVRPVEVADVLPAAAEVPNVDVQMIWWD